MKFRQSLYAFFLMVCVNIQVSANPNDSTLNKLTQYVRVINHFSRNLPQEKVYVHMDNTCYYQGDDRMRVSIRQVN